VSQYDSESPSGWAIGGLSFAAAMILMMGVFQSIAGVVAIFNDEFYARVGHYTFDLDITAWGWIHLILGVLLVITAMALFQQKVWAGMVALILAILSAIDNFFFLPYYPFWSAIQIGLAVWVLWALTRPGTLR
jgi:hypothetical protein